jgi:Zn-dependent protease
MGRSFLVFENLETTPRRRLFSLLGVDWVATPYAWLSLPFWCAIGVLCALAERSGAGIGLRLAGGVAYGVMLALCNTAHSVGHIVSARLAGTPIDALLLTATRDVTLYFGAKRTASRGVRIGRALGGPLASLSIGLVALGLSRVVGGAWLAMFAYFNLAVGAWTLMPVPSLDGWVIWGGLLARRRG